MEEKELIEFIAKRLVDDPDGVNVKIIEGEKSTILEISLIFIGFSRKSVIMWF